MAILLILWGWSFRLMYTIVTTMFCAVVRDWGLEEIEAKTEREREREGEIDRKREREREREREGGGGR